MNRKTILITGANAGIGYEITRGVLLRKHTAIMVCRNKEKAYKAREELAKSTQNENIHIIIADLNDFSGIQHLTEEVQRNFEKIDVLVNNAGTFYSSWKLNNADIERTFMVNHLAPFYLTHLLLPELARSNDAKIVNINSDSHFMAKLRPDNLNLKNNFHGLRAYGHSKLANVMFTYEFERRKPYPHISIHAVHPGLVNTDIGAKHTHWFHRTVWNWRSKKGKTPKEGAETALFIINTPGSKLESGRYWDDGKPKKSSVASYDEAMAEKLWDKSKDLCGIVDFF